ncbi:Ubiquitin-conjugating enzyme E2 E1-like protein [Aphelenchoides besseyi]|nr:Ubiquitin-conjugating enzyme E2 E1-like protein [Aphelenchoides besseyi]KAI6208290.1 Ubiquitin-conjugating enzyme E2 E1-like protein [Aphelenchoides besseyi]
MYRQPLNRYFRNSELTRSNSVFTRRLVVEAKNLVRNPVTGCEAVPRDDDVLEWSVVIEGPEGSLYEGGTFFAEFSFNDNYPFEAPKITFLTRIYHCNIDNYGRINLDFTPTNWNPCSNVSDVLKSIVKLLIQCNPKNGLVRELVRQYEDDPLEYEKNAREWTKRYAH